jgi:hypothetical protein
VAKRSLKRKPKWKIKKTAAFTAVEDHPSLCSKDCFFKTLTLQVIGSGLWAGWDNA